MDMLMQRKVNLKFERLRQQFGCGYYSFCCREHCPCGLKGSDLDIRTLQEIKQEFDEKSVELFGA